jgi:hypothetical protein
MKENIETTRWADYLNEYTRRNEGRPTRLEVIGGADNDDFWLECGLRLTGIDADTRGADAPRVEIMLGGVFEPDGTNHFTRSISNVRRVTPEIGENGRDKGIEFEDAKAVTTILRFETLDA